MKILKSKKWIVLLISLALIITLGMTYSEEPEKIAVAGVHKVSYTAQHTVEICAKEGHMLYLNKMEGTNASEGEVKFMDGAKVFNAGFADYIKGNGKHWGYSIMSLNGDAIYSEYKGETKTTPSEKGEPVTTIEGKFKMVKGSGKYENIKGGGTYKGKVIPGKDTTELITKWEGKYYIKK